MDFSIRTKELASVHNTEVHRMMSHDIRNFTIYYGAYYASGIPTIRGAGCIIDSIFIPAKSATFIPAN